MKVDGDEESPGFTEPGRERKLVPQTFGTSDPISAPAMSARGRGRQWIVSLAPWRWPRGLLSGWYWLLLGALVLAAFGFGIGYSTSPFTASVTLVRTESPARRAPGVEDAAASGRHSVQTVVDILRTAEVRRRVAAGLKWPATAEAIAAHSAVSQVENTDLIRLKVWGSDPERVVELANQYAQEAVACVQKLEADESSQIDHSLQEKVATVDRALASAGSELRNFQRTAGVDDLEKEIAAGIQQRAALAAKAEAIRLEVAALDVQIQNLQRDIGQHHPALLEAKQALDRALVRYTEEHPKVQELKAAVASIEARVAAPGHEVDPEIALAESSLIKNLYAKMIELRTQRASLGKQLEAMEALRKQWREKLAGLSARQLDYAKLQSQFDALKSTRDRLVGQQQEARLPGGSAGGFYRIYEPAQAEDISRLPKLQAGAWLALGAGLAGLLVAGLLIVGLEASDRRIRSAEDLKRWTRLPVLATLGDLGEMSPAEQEQWAFRTLVRLTGELKGAPGQALVLGFTSSNHGEGRSTWVSLLAQAARKQGYRVLTIAAAHSHPHPSQPKDVGTGAQPDCTAQLAPLATHGALQAPGASLRVEIPLPGWVWNMQSRAQWQTALQQVAAAEHSIVLVELPPASEPEGVLLAESFSQVIWLCGKDMATEEETRTRLQMLKDSRARVAGAVFNARCRPAGGKRTSQFIAGLALALSLGLGRLSAQETNAPGAEAGAPNTDTNRFSISAPMALADWQKHLTLGPGDILTISMYERPDSTRLGLIIGPDGRINYLQARDVMAAGFTVEELREQLEKALLKFYRPPLRVVVIPQAYNSKRYYMLGNVVQKGVFQLDRPITVVEAIARAQGFVTSIQRKNTFTLVDLSRSFLIRKQDGAGFQRVPVDFEALFLRGEISQNIALAPEDYLYFPPMDLQEVYVFGEVLRPGISPYAPDITALRAIVSRGGFTERAYKGKILVVRGSLNHPQTFVLSGTEVLRAKSLDFRLEPRDIVYVHRRPWTKVQELLELSIADFLQAAVVTWTGLNVGPLIKEPIIK